MAASSSKEEIRNFSIAERLQIFVIATLGYWLVWLINLTVRYQYLGFERFEKGNRDAGVILSFWHNQIFMATFAFRFRKIVVMISRAFDGEYIAQIIRAFGYGTARGSSSRGAVRALLEMKQYLEAGRDVGFSIDGPRGPRYQVKSGPLWLASKTGRPILCFHVQSERFWELKSWDGFRIPKPFSRATVYIGEPFSVPKNADPEGYLEVFQEEMDRLQRWAETHS